MAIVGHAVLLGLLLPLRHASPDALPDQPIEVTLELAPATAVSPAPSASTDAPRSDPEPPITSAPAPPAPVLQPTPRPDAPAPLVRPEPARSAPHARRPPTKPVIQPRAAKPEAFGTGMSADAPAAPSPAPVAPQPPTAEALGAWRSALAAWLQQHRTYPDAARRDGVEGRVVVRFTMDAAGLVTVVTLAGSSGSPILDEAAQFLLRGAHLPPPPPPAPDHLTITLPVRYTLAP